MTMTPTQIKILVAAEAILQTIEEAGEEGAPSGALYAAFMQFGFSYHQYQSMIDLFLRKGYVRISNHVLYYTAKKIGKPEGTC